MRNLKKILALALALTMVLSMMVTASAAFTDEDKFDADYAESVKVLAGMGVFQGFPDGSFKPGNTITRAQVAAILYRIDTQDVEDKKADLFKGTAQFSDVGNEWYAGYVGYCANAGYIKGFPDGTFRPDDEVTGIQTLAMILRVMGYDAANEFSGTQWANEIAKIATREDILDDVKPGQLSGDASRELVAELLFEAIQQRTVRYSAIRMDYQTESAKGLGWDNFELKKTEGLNDKWGRPYYAWTYTTGDEETDFFETPNAVFYTETNDCEIAAELGEDEDFTLQWYDNGEHLGVVIPSCDHDEDDKTDPIKDCFHADLVKFDVTDRKNERGGQGVLLEFYDDEVVQIDTYLAEVTDVTEVEYDRKGHIEDPAELDLKVWFDSKTPDPETLTDDEDFEYEVGDMLLVHYNKAKDAWYIEGISESIVGKQSAYTNTATHIVDDEEYPDAENFFADFAVNRTSEYNWFFDQYGNLIGAFEVEDVYSYGVISSIYWKDSNNGDDGYAMAEITYMDGTSEKMKVTKINGITLAGVESKLAADGSDFGWVSSTKQYNKDTYVRTALYEISGSTLKRATKLSADAQVETGVPEIDEDVYASKSTKFLVYTDGEYETYTGIKNVPDFKTGEYWAVLDGEAAEYVFIKADAVDANKDFFFFAEYGTKLKIKTYLDDNDVEYWTINGGLVDGVEAEVMTKEEWVKDDIVKYRGTLMYLEATNGYVDGCYPIAGWDYLIDDEIYADYVGPVANVTLSDDDSVMTAEGQYYDVEEAEIIAYNGRSLAKNVKNGDGYMFVVFEYAKKGDVKNAKYVIITDCMDAEKMVARQVLRYELRAAIEAAGATEEQAKYCLNDATTQLGMWANNPDEGKYYDTMVDLINTWTKEIQAKDSYDAIWGHVDTLVQVFKTSKNAAGQTAAQVYVDGLKMPATEAAGVGAIKNAVAGQTIVLGANVTLPNELTAGITIDAQGKTLTISKGEGDWNRLKSAGSTIVNAVIEGDKIVLDEDITFENCVFEGNLDNSVPAKTTFIDCVFNGTVLFAHGSADVTEVEGSALVATDCVFNKWVKLTDFASVVFTDCEFNGNTGWSNATMQTEVATTFDGCTFNRTGTVLYDVRIGLGQSADMITVKNGTCDIATKSGTNPVVVVTK